MTCGDPIICWPQMSIMQKKEKEKKDILYEADGANCLSHTVVLILWMISLLTIKSKKCAVSKTKLQFHQV